MPTNNRQIVSEPNNDDTNADEEDGQQPPEPNYE
jgi:hypothetical protein